MVTNKFEGKICFFKKCKKFGVFNKTMFSFIKTKIYWLCRTNLCVLDLGTILIPKLLG